MIQYRMSILQWKLFFSHILVAFLSVSIIADNIDVSDLFISLSIFCFVFYCTQKIIIGFINYRIRRTSKQGSKE